MLTNYFYCRLFPSSTANPVYYSYIFPITYASPGDCNAQQTQFEGQFRAAIGNPPGYNASWSVGDTQPNTQTAKTQDIQNVQVNGYVALDNQWQP